MPDTRPLDTRLNSALAANPDALLKLGMALIDNGQADKAAALVEQALSERPDDPWFAQVATILLSRGLPNYHFAMLADEPRNAAFAAAIARHAPGKAVLDIGSGSGLLAMLAARCGASRVTGCEANGALAATARRIVDANGLGDRVTIITAHSTRLDRDGDLGGPVDLIVTETFGHDLVGEDALHSLGDAVGRLAGPDARVIPARAQLRVALAQLDRVRQPLVGAVCGFDLGLFNRHAGREYRLAVGDPALALRSEPVDLFTFDLAGPATIGSQRASCSVRSSGGRVDGVVQWLRIELDEAGHYENRPGPQARSHWQAVFWPIPAAVDTAGGECFTITGWLERSRLVIGAALAG